MAFEFATAGRIVFGRGCAARIGEEAAQFGRRVFVLTGRRRERWAFLWEDLRRRGMDCERFAIMHEPTVTNVEQAVQMAAAAGVDVVIGIGGGSVIDAAKAVAAKLPNPGDLLNFLEVIGQGRPLENPSLPCIAVPTTAGTGAEVTRNAVLRSEAHGVKVSLRSDTMLPVRAMVDPDLTLSVSPEMTAGTGLDALTQLQEAFVSQRGNPLTDGLCREGLRRAARSLERAFAHGDDSAAREDMALASLFGGLALANAGLGAVHGFAGPLGGMVPAAHGMICAALLPPVMAANIQALTERDPDHPSLDRYRETAVLLTGRADATAKDGVAWVRQLCHRLKVPSLERLGFTAAQTAEAVSKACRASSMKGNPVMLTEEELAAIYRNAL
ncbi:MAG: iron-containing alcohol dehydrogenase [Desulfobacteraceae bacterium]|nr:iron-containing alcohol dehydrogenase [Desulfobacteraceae bacterium]MBC2753906.1 iron-containing alcohol dehydrogenase [Desulfobacteraceae bacterium]